MAAITTAGIGLATAGYSIYQGEKQRKEASEALNSFERQDLDNAFEDLPISTIGSDLIREENARTATTGVNAARQAGTRGILSTIPKIQAQTNKSNQDARAYLDGQVTRRNYAIAGDNQRIRGIQENRDNQELAGIGQLEEVGNQNVWNGIRGASNSLMYGANNIDFGESRPKTETVTDMNNYTNLIDVGQPEFSDLDAINQYSPSAQGF